MFLVVVLFVCFLISFFQFCSIVFSLLFTCSLTHTYTNTLTQVASVCTHYTHKKSRICTHTHTHTNTHTHTHTHTHTLMPSVYVLLNMHAYTQKVSPNSMHLSLHPVVVSCVWRTVREVIIGFLKKVVVVCVTRPVTHVLDLVPVTAPDAHNHSKY